jgi:hypothetical protein
VPEVEQLFQKVLWQLLRTSFLLKKKARYGHVTCKVAVRFGAH